MSVIPPITNRATGQPVKASVPVRVNTEPTRNGILNSAVESKRELNNLIQQRNTPSVDQLGRSSSKIVNKIRSGSRIDLEI